MNSRYAISFPVSKTIQAEDLILALENVYGSGVTCLAFTVIASPSHYHISVSIGGQEIPSPSVFSQAKRATWFCVPLPPLNWRFARMAGQPEWTSPLTLPATCLRKNLFPPGFRKEFSLPHTLKRRQDQRFMLAQDKVKGWLVSIDTIHLTHERTYYASRLN